MSRSLIARDISYLFLPPSSNHNNNNSKRQKTLRFQSNVWWGCTTCVLCVRELVRLLSIWRDPSPPHVRLHCKYSRNHLRTVTFTLWFSFSFCDIPVSQSNLVNENGNSCAMGLTARNSQIVRNKYLYSWHSYLESPVKVSFPSSMVNSQTKHRAGWSMRKSYSISQNVLTVFELKSKKFVLRVKKKKKSSAISLFPSMPLARTSKKKTYFGNPHT